MERVKLTDRPVARPPLASPRTETIQLVPVEPAHRLLDMPFVHQEAPRRRPYSVKAKLFTGLVVVPLLAVTVYLFLFAADRYVSEASFIVRSAVSQSPVGGLPAMHGDGGLADAVNTYILSRDMVDQLERQNGLRDVLSQGRWDFVYRFPVFWRRDDKEQLYRHYLMMVDAEVDKTNGINTIAVRTFRPEDSQR
jgi:capsular polysaccharide transport system permease protein